MASLRVFVKIKEIRLVFKCIFDLVEKVNVNWAHYGNERCNSFSGFSGNMMVEDMWYDPGIYLDM